VAGGCTEGHSTSQSSGLTAVPSPARSILGSPDPRELELGDLVPRGSRITHVWFVPGGSTVPEVVVAWSYHGRHVASAPSDERYALTVWHPKRMSPGEARWRPKTLFRGSPFALSWRSVRTADVTGDRHRDLLITVECDGCNHAVAAVSVYADAREGIRRIYGVGFLDGTKEEHVGVRGRVIAETAWGAWHGLVWFDEPRGGESVCCPDYRLQTFLKWNRGRWQTVKTRKLTGRDDFLGQRPFPAP
jgi:hypothetical protein